MLTLEVDILQRQTAIAPVRVQLRQMSEKNGEHAPHQQESESNERHMEAGTHTVPEMVPEPKRSPTRSVQPVIVWCAIICRGVQYRCCTRTPSSRILARRTSLPPNCLLLLSYCVSASLPCHCVNGSAAPLQPHAH